MMTTIPRFRDVVCVFLAQVNTAVTNALAARDLKQTANGGPRIAYVLEISLLNDQNHEI